MANMNVDQKIHYVPLVNYVQKVTGSTSTPCINMKLYEKVDFYIKCEALATANFTVTVVQSTATTATSTATVSARYRISAAAGTDTMGAVVPIVAATGFAILNTNDYKTYIVSVESQDLTTADKPYLGLTFTDPGTADAYVTIWAMCWPKYPQKTNANALT